MPRIPAPSAHAPALSLLCVADSSANIVRCGNNQKPALSVGSTGNVKSKTSADDDIDATAVYTHGVTTAEWAVSSTCPLSQQLLHSQSQSLSQARPQSQTSQVQSAMELSQSPQERKTALLGGEAASVVTLASNNRAQQCAARLHIDSAISSTDISGLSAVCSDASGVRAAAVKHVWIDIRKKIGGSNSTPTCSGAPTTRNATVSADSRASDLANVPANANSSGIAAASASLKWSGASSVNNNVVSFCVDGKNYRRRYYYLVRKVTETRAHLAAAVAKEMADGASANTASALDLTMATVPQTSVTTATGASSDDAVAADAEVCGRNGASGGSDRMSVAMLTNRCEYLTSKLKQLGIFLSLPAGVIAEIHEAASAAYAGSTPSRFNTAANECCSEVLDVRMPVAVGAHLGVKDASNTAPCVKASNSGAVTGNRKKGQPQKQQPQPRVTLLQRPRNNRSQADASTLSASTNCSQTQQQLLCAGTASAGTEMSVTATVSSSSLSPLPSPSLPLTVQHQLFQRQQQHILSKQRYLQQHVYATQQKQQLWQLALSAQPHTAQQPQSSQQEQQLQFPQGNAVTYAWQQQQQQQSHQRQHHGGNNNYDNNAWSDEQDDMSLTNQGDCYCGIPHCDGCAEFVNPSVGVFVNHGQFNNNIDGDGGYPPRMARGDTGSCSPHCSLRAAAATRNLNAQLPTLQQQQQLQQRPQHQYHHQPQQQQQQKPQYFVPPQLQPVSQSHQQQLHLQSLSLTQSQAQLHALLLRQDQLALRQQLQQQQARSQLIPVATDQRSMQRQGGSLSQLQSQSQAQLKANAQPKPQLPMQLQNQPQQKLRRGHARSPQAAGGESRMLSVQRKPETVVVEGVTYTAVNARGIAPNNAAVLSSASVPAASANDRHLEVIHGGCDRITANANAGIDASESKTGTVSSSNQTSPAATTVLRFGDNGSADTCEAGAVSCGNDGRSDTSSCCDFASLSPQLDEVRYFLPDNLFTPPNASRHVLVRCNSSVRTGACATAPTVTNNSLPTVSDAPISAGTTVPGGHSAYTCGSGSINDATSNAMGTTVVGGLTRHMRRHFDAHRYQARVTSDVELRSTSTSVSELLSQQQQPPLPLTLDSLPETRLPKTPYNVTILTSKASVPKASAEFVVPAPSASGAKSPLSGNDYAEGTSKRATACAQQSMILGSQVLPTDVVAGTAVSMPKNAGNTCTISVLPASLFSPVSNSKKAMLAQSQAPSSVPASLDTSNAVAHTRPNMMSHVSKLDDNSDGGNGSKSSVCTAINDVSEHGFVAKAKGGKHGNSRGRIPARASGSAKCLGPVTPTTPAVSGRLFITSCASGKGVQVQRLASQGEIDLSTSETEPTLSHMKKIKCSTVNSNGQSNHKAVAASANANSGTESDNEWNTASEAEAEAEAEAEIVAFISNAGLIASRDSGANRKPTLSTFAEDSETVHAAVTRASDFEHGDRFITCSRSFVHALPLYNTNSAPMSPGLRTTQSVNDQTHTSTASGRDVRACNITAHNHFSPQSYYYNKGVDTAATDANGAHKNDALNITDVASSTSIAGETHSRPPRLQAQPLTVCTSTTLVHSQLSAHSHLAAPFTPRQLKSYNTLKGGHTSRNNGLSNNNASVDAALTSASATTALTPPEHLPLSLSTPHNSNGNNLRVTGNMSDIEHFLATATPEATAKRLLALETALIKKRAAHQTEKTMLLEALQRVKRRLILATKYLDLAIEERDMLVDVVVGVSEKAGVRVPPLSLTEFCKKNGNTELNNK